MTDLGLYIGAGVAAVVLDLLVGEPPSSLHPVRLIGLMIWRIEAFLRRAFRERESEYLYEYLGGFLLVVIVVAATLGSALGLLYIAGAISGSAYFAVATLLIYTSIAQKELALRGRQISRDLGRGEVKSARRRLKALVGRDTDDLSASDIARASVESVAENTSDGIIAPLFYAMTLGPAFALLFRAINTIDSMVGYRNLKYQRFGWAGARLDDVACYIPARVTAGIFILASVVRRRSIRALIVTFRDARKHESPNAGFPEAAIAGALGVQLGGVNYYGGQEQPAVILGRAGKAPRPADIDMTVRMMRIGVSIYLGAAICLWLVGEYIGRVIR